MIRDMVFVCRTKCVIRETWKRQIATIELAPEDALTERRTGDLEPA